MNGVEACKAIRDYEGTNQQIQEVPIIAMTANAIQNELDKLLSEGMNGCLTKPFKIKELEEILNNSVRNESGIS